MKERKVTNWINSQTLYMRYIPETSISKRDKKKMSRFKNL